jgi:hypothetical protein
MLARNVPQQVYIGSTNDSKSKKFNDTLELTKQGGLAKINALKVFYNDKYVVGFIVYYKLSDGDLLKARHNVPEKGDKKLQRRLLEIGPDDYLLEISGHLSEKGITRLTFQTYRGKVGTYGSDEGVPFLHRFDGFTFGAFSGGHRDYLQHLEVLVHPVPKQFLDELTRPVQVNLTVFHHTNQQGQLAPCQHQAGPIPGISLPPAPTQPSLGFGGSAPGGLGSSSSNNNNNNNINSNGGSGFSISSGNNNNLPHYYAPPGTGQGNKTTAFASVTTVSAQFVRPQFIMPPAAPQYQQQAGFNYPPPPPFGVPPVAYAPPSNNQNNNNNNKGNGGDNLFNSKYPGFD